MHHRAAPVRSLRRPAGFVLAAALAAGMLVACEPPPEDPPTPPGSPAPSPPVADPVLDRAAILAAVDAAASDAAAGVAPSADADPLANRRFRMRIAFGCDGPDPVPPDKLADAGVPAWSRAPDGRSIRLRFTPADWTDGEMTGPAVEGFEKVGGVWVNQPWMRSDACPAPGAPTVETPASPAPRDVGLALLLADGASRLGRADDFTFTVRGSGDAPAPDPVRGYRLLLEGRLTPWADGRVIRCAVSRPHSRPICTVGVVLERLAYEDGATRAVLSEWRPG